MSAFGGKADIDRPFRRIGSPAGSACYFFVIIVIRYETTATAGWALLFIVRTFFNYAFAIALWTSFHVARLTSLYCDFLNARGQRGVPVIGRYACLNTPALNLTLGRAFIVWPLHPAASYEGRRKATGRSSFLPKQNRRLVRL